MATSVNLTDGLTRREYEKLSDMTEEERLALFEDQLQNVRGADIEEIKEKLEKDFKKIKTEFEDLESDLKHEFKSLSRELSKAEKQEFREAIKAANDAWEEALAEEITAALDEHAEQFVDLTDGSAHTISDIDPNGKTYEYTLGSGNVIEIRDPELKFDSYDPLTNTMILTKGTTQVIIKNAISKNPFADAANGTGAPRNPNSTEPLMYQGKRVTNDAGQVILDANSDGVYNHADIKFAEEHQPNSDPDMAAQGNVFRFFYPVMTLDEMKTRSAQQGELLDSFYYMNDEKSFQDHVEELNGIPGNQDVPSEQEQLNAIVGYAQINPNPAPTGAPEGYAMGATKLYLHLNSYYEGKDVKEVWREILNNRLLGEPGTPAQLQAQKDLINALIANIAKHGRPSDFEKLFGPASAMLQAILGTDLESLDAASLASVMILEFHGGTPNLGGTSILDKFAKKDDQGLYHEGELKNHARNEEALGVYSQIIAQSQFTPTAGVNTAKDNEYVFSHNGTDRSGRKVQIYSEPATTDKTRYTSPRDEFNQFFDALKNAPHDEVGNGEWACFVNKLRVKLFDGATGEFVQDVWGAIVAAFDSDGTEIETDDQDEIMYAFVNFLDGHATSQFKRTMYNLGGGGMIDYLSNEDLHDQSGMVTNWGTL